MGNGSVGIVGYYLGNGVAIADPAILLTLETVNKMTRRVKGMEIVNDVRRLTCR